MGDRSSACAFALAVLVSVGFLAGCGARLKMAGSAGATIARSHDYAVLIPDDNDSYESLAARYYGDPGLAYLLREYNRDRPLSHRRAVVVPLKPINPGGLAADGYRTVPVLCYHHFDNPGAGEMSVGGDAFAAQLAYLKEHGYRTATLDELAAFVAYQRRLPAKSVVISIDDGWQSLKTVAVPALKQYGFHAVLFLNTSQVRAKPDAVTLTWDELRELVATGVLDVQSHTVSHADLTKLSGEQLDRELAESKRLIEQQLGVKVRYLAYPYGTFNDQILAAMKRQGYALGLTVVRGGNPFFAEPLALQRSMIYGSGSLDDFVRQLDVFRPD